MDEELLTRQPPQSLEAEQAVLGSILIDSRCVTDVVGLVKPEDFYLQQNREIYEAIRMRSFCSKAFSARFHCLRSERYQTSVVLPFSSKPF